MKVLISRRAQREAERIDAQWREAADYSEVFANEFAEWVDKLGELSGIGSAWPTERRPNLCRLQLPKSEVHLYFTKEGNVVRIMAVWWSRRARTPNP